jgi:hypothetical protein
MSRTRDEMRLYQRTRRARIKAGTWPSNPKDAPAAARRSAFATFVDRSPARAAVARSPWTPASVGPPRGTAPVAPATLSGDSTPGGPPSTPAIGGRPGPGLIPCGPGYPLPPDQFALSPFGRWQANVETMLATLAARNDTQEQRIAALESQVAERRNAALASRERSWN